MMRAIPIAVSFQGFIRGPPFVFMAQVGKQINRLPWDGLQRVCQTQEHGLARIRAELWNRAGIRARLRVTSATECCALYSTGWLPRSAEIRDVSDVEDLVRE